MTQDSSNQSVDKFATLLSGIVLGTIGVLSFIVQPGLVQGFVTESGLSEADANQLAFMEMLGVAIATYITALFAPRVSWRLILSIALIVAVLGNLLSLALISSPSIGYARFITGLGEGAIISLSFSVIGLTQRIEKNLALYLVLLLTYGALGLWAMPVAFDVIGLQGIFLFWAILTALSLLTVRHIPTSSHDHIQHRESARQMSLKLRVYGLTGVLLFNLAVGIAWANLFLIGMEILPDEQKIANALLLCQFVAIGGAVIPVFLEEKSGVISPIAITIFGISAFIGLLLGNPTYVTYVWVVCGFNFLWNMGMPYILSAVGNMDLSGSMITIAIALQMTGLGFGPLLAAAILGQQGTFREVELLTVGLFIVSAIPLFIALWAHKRTMAIKEQAL